MNKTTDFRTTNQDYGSFHFGRLQHGYVDPAAIAFELAINDQVRKERRHLPAIAYDIMFDKGDSLKIVTHEKSKAKPIVTRRQLKFITSKKRTSGEERQRIIRQALESYLQFIKCIYDNKSKKNPRLSIPILELIAYELFEMNSDVSTDELVENMLAITVPHQYMGVPSIDPSRPYPGTAADCSQTPRFQRLLDHFKAAETLVSEGKDRFDSQAIGRQRFEGERYIYNPFTSAVQRRT